MSKQIKNILFDFGGVIVGLDKQVAINRFKDLGLVNIEDYLTEFRQKGIFLAYEEGKISREDFLAEFSKLAGRDDITMDQIDHAWLGFLTYIPEYKFQLLKDLRKKYNVYLLSNTNPSVMTWANSTEFSPEGLPITAYFDHCYLSYKLGHAKPDKEIYELIVEHSGMNPAETLFLDDGKTNIEVSEQLGFKGYLANQDEDLRKAFEEMGLL